MIQFVAIVKKSAVNIHEAFKFYDENQDQTIKIDDFIKILKFTKTDFNKEEIEFFVNNIRAGIFSINYQKFLNYYDSALQDCVYHLFIY